MISLAEETLTEDISSDHIMVENYFRRLCQLWSVVLMKFRWCEGLYGLIYAICASLTNLNMSLNPLRNEEWENYQLICCRLISNGDEISRKCKRPQEKYRERRRRRMEIQFREMNGTDYDGETNQSPSPTAD